MPYAARYITSSTMNDLGYRRCGSRRGFRVYPVKRVSVKTLRVRFVRLFQLLKRWRRAYGRAVRVIRRGICRDHDEDDVAAATTRTSKMDIGSISQRSLVREVKYVRSNSFYSEAIKECLEFIKRNSVSYEQNQKLLEEDDRVRSPPEYGMHVNKAQLLHDEDPSSNMMFLPNIV